MAINTYQTASDQSRRQQYEHLRAQLWMDRSSFDSHWKLLADFVKPRRMRAFVADKNRGDRRNQNIIDSTASFALRTLQSGMHAGLTSPARPWFKLSTSDPDLAKFKPVQQWLHDVTDRMLAAFLKSNLYTALPTIYGDQALFATAACGVIDDARDIFRCYPYPIGTYALGVSERGIVDTFLREYSMTVRQLVETFGRIPGTSMIDWSNISITVKSLWDKGAYEQNLEVCWLVRPNPDHDPRKLQAKFLPWSSCYFEKGEDSQDKFLRESGFNEFPILAPRWDVVAEDTYGTDCPAITALGDIKGLQVMTKRKAQGVEKMINPPLQAPTSVRNQKVSLLSGDVTYVDVLQQQQGIRPIHDVALPVEQIRVDINDMRFLIRRAFYEDLFLMIASMDAQSQNTQRTAREIEERHEEKLLALGPVVERNNDELHEPLIDRVYPMMDRAGQIPPAPKELQGIALKVEYLSMLSQAQKLVSVGGLDRFMGVVMPMVQLFPEAKHKIDTFKIVDEYAEALGINPELILDNDEALQRLQAEQQQMQQERQAQIAALSAKSTKDLAASPTDGKTALAEIANSSQ